MYLCKWLGIEDETMFVITGNHGMNNWNETFFERINKRVILPVYEVVIASGLEYVPGSRGIYLPGATEKEIESMADEIADKRFVDFVIYQKNDNEIIIKGKSGTSEIVVERWGEKIPDTVYSYRVLEGSDPITEGDILTHSSFYGLRIDELNEPGEVPAPIQYPDMITRALGLLCSENAPDLIVSIGVGGTSHHGDFCYEESVVPLIFAGPGIKKIKTEEMISITDIAPTIMKAMGFREPINCDGRALDILGGNTKYALPSVFRMRIPLYFPLPIIGFSFLLQIPFVVFSLLPIPPIPLLSISGIRDLIQIKRIITIREIRAMLPDPPEYLGTYPSEVLRTFFL
jgi:arylsulfatase A-like enzyme